MARIGRSFPAKAIIGRPRPSTFGGSGAFAMSLTLASSGGTVVPPFAPHSRIVLQAMNRAGNFHHKPKGPSWLTWPPLPPMPQ
jgi:hypothetical protein